jgi:hypothetical membrane protein
MATSANIKQERPLLLRLLLACGALGPMIFIVVFLIAGATRSDYSPLRHPISSLSIGELGWVQIADFVVTGSLLVAFAAGLRRILQTPRLAVGGQR